jgi:hypothetical protein
LQGWIFLQNVLQSRQGTIIINLSTKKRHSKLKEDWMMKKVLWKWDYSEDELLVDLEEIKERIPFGEEPTLVEFNESVDLGDLNAKLKAYMEENDDISGWLGYDELEKFFQVINLHPTNITGIDFYGNPDEHNDSIIYDPNVGEFHLGKDWDVIKVYEYWDGHNWITKSGEEAIEYVVEVEEEQVNLDEWNGSNFQTSGTGLHQYIQKIVEVDDEKVEDKYLLVRWSQWQGSLPSGELMSIEEIKEHLELLGRDVNKYMTEIGEKLGE